jgi:tRNA threonylcarbamoyladenosine biosynthesis protein TsaB
VLGAAGAGWEEVDRIAVGVGPGTFTGLRIGVATAHALARAREIELVGVSTLHSLARGAAGAGAGEDPAPDVVVAVIDARRGEVFAAGWVAAEAGRAGAEPLIGPRALAPETLAQTMLGDGRAW